MSSSTQEQPSRYRSNAAKHDSLTPSNGAISPNASPNPSETTDRQSEAESLNIGPSAMEDDNQDDYDDGDISILQDNIMKQSRTIDDFTRIIADWRNEREKRQRGDGASMRTSFYGCATPGDNAGASTSALGARSLQIKGSTLSLRRDVENKRQSLDVDSASQYSYEPSSVGDQDDVAVSRSASPISSLSPLALQAEGSSKGVKVRCTCCCGRGTRRCKRARRATREWSEVESDLRLAAEIGQALLRRNDALQSELNQNQQDYSTRIDSLMKKLSSSIREASMLEKQREQSELNVEAADASNRSLVRELDECRRELTRLRGANTRNTGLESKLERSMREVGDLKQELVEEKKRRKKVEKQHSDVSNDLRIALIEGKRQAPINSEDGARRREEIKALSESRMASTLKGTGAEETEWADGMMAENEELQKENQQLKEILEARSEELAQMREEWNQREEIVTSVIPTEDGKATSASLLDLPSKTFGALSSEFIEDDGGVGDRKTLSSIRSASRSPSRSGQNEGEFPSSALLSPALASESGQSHTESVVSVDTNETTIIDGEGNEKQERSSSLLVAPAANHKALKENRTAQLMTLIETVQRIFTRLSSADVDTLSKRLQRQNLTGDVGHLARTTVNGILRDVEGLRDHFRKGMELESRSRDIDTASMGSKNSNRSEKESDSLVARKEFFALIKVFRELFVEMARLRKTVNEISIQPQYAARILQEQLGLKSNEDKGMGAWIGRMFSATPLPGVGGITGGTSSATSSLTPSSQPSSTSGAGVRPLSNRVTSGPQLTSRASAAVLPSTVAVEVKGTHAAEQLVADSKETKAQDMLPSHARPMLPRNQRSLSRAQSRNLSGLFVGSISANEEGNGGFEHNFEPTASHTRLSSEQQQQRQHRLSRIVDDDEVSIHQGFTPKMGLRPRNLSDSSIRTTYMQDEDKVGSKQFSNPHHHHKAPAAISRIITPSTLSLQVSSLLDTGVVHSSTSATFSDDSSSTLSRNSTTARESTPIPASSGFLSGLAPRPVSKALSFLSGPSAPPPLRNTPSSAKLSLAAASTSASSKSQNRGAGADDLLRVGQNRARNIGGF